VPNYNRKKTTKAPVSEPYKKYTIAETAKRWDALFNSPKYSSCDYGYAIQNSALNSPYVQNQRLKMLKSQPVMYDRDLLEQSLLNPQWDEMLLRQISWNLTSSSYPLYKLMRMYADMLTYRHYAYPKYVNREEMDTPRFKSDSKLVHMWLDKLDLPTTIRRIMMEILREGKRAYYLRQKMNTTTGKESVEYVTLQELPSDWIKMTAKSDNSYYVASMNFVYFWTPGTSVLQFAPEFQTYYEELMGCSSKNKSGAWEINLAKATGSGTTVEYSDGLWYFWKEMPSDLCWTFCMDESHSWQIPPFMGLFLTAQDLQSYAYLQQQLTSIPLYGLVLAEIPFHDGASNKSGTYTDDMRLSPDAINVFSSMFNQTAPPGTGVYAAPFTNMQYIKFPEIPNSNVIYEKALQGMIATAGTTGLQSTSEKPSIAMVKASQLIESRFADVIYGQVDKFVNTSFEKHLGLKYTWRFHIFGNIFTEQQEIANLEKDIAMGQVALMPKYLAMRDIDMEEAICNSDWVDSLKLYDKMKTPPSAFQTAGGGTSKTKETKPTGRPTIENPDNENTAASKDQGTNLGVNREKFAAECPICGNPATEEFAPFCSQDCKDQYIENQEDGDIE